MTKYLIAILVVLVGFIAYAQQKVYERALGPLNYSNNLIVDSDPILGSSVDSTRFQIITEDSVSYIAKKWEIEYPGASKVIGAGILTMLKVTGTTADTFVTVAPTDGYYQYGIRLEFQATGNGTSSPIVRAFQQRYLSY